MKKMLIGAVLLTLVLLLPAKADKFFISAGAAALFPGDNSFSEKYGNVQASPEIKAGYNLYRNFYFWLGGSFFSAKYTIPVLEDELKTTQTFLSLGAGWETRSGRRLQANLSAALLLAGFREKGMGETASKSAPGFDVGAGLRYFLRKRVFLELALGYAGAWTTFMTETGERDIILGGLRLAGRLGFRF